ncbi:SMU1112c/YaeR family gloxylase I-like metalloprotein [Vibrio methylphosphonaticus]|uniref:SMU1112c/YaeR family gloxylase I-like metalloprotein n=1 Tax=Vibrio methylphosphonaticus TaxID=2946866 RepID=UPI00202A590F|nr:VOC family protein [Vibrio methylphosphonaticus]MCL9776267.1 VOC family protein [Vibrio methylphosphonaticus]
MLKGTHHVAIICSNYTVSKHFYTQILGLAVLDENYREARDSHKLDLALPDGTQIELFSFPNAPLRPDTPEAQGLRHLAFTVENIAHSVAWLTNQSIDVEPIRVDEYTGKRYTFFKDPDGLPLELCEELSF